MRMAAAGRAAVMLDAVILTHLHSDHICDLGDVITTQWVMSPVPKTLRIFGPVGTQEVVDGCMAMLRQDVGYRRAHHEDLNWDPQLEVTEIGPDWVLDGEVRITAAATDHRPVEPTLAFRIDHDGQSAVIAGDTVPCAGLDELCRGCRRVRADRAARRPREPGADAAVPRHDRLPLDRRAGRADRRAAGVRTLVLTHQIPTPPPGAADEWIAIAAQHFDGRIVFGDDLTQVTTAPE